jgi:hypothetical protein
VIGMHVTKPPKPRPKRPLTLTVREPKLPADVAALKSALDKVPGFPGAGLFVRSGRVDS